MMNRTNIKEYIFFGMNPYSNISLLPEVGIEVELVDRKDLIHRSLSGDYKQLAGLGVIQLASNYLGLDILSRSIDDIYKIFNQRVKNEC